MTTKQKHTPGPWRQYQGGLVICISDDSSLGVMSAGYPDISDEEQLANARLVAAAPELLAGLREALNAYILEAHFRRTDHDMVARLHGIIAKAEGRKPPEAA